MQRHCGLPSVHAPNAHATKSRLMRFTGVVFFSVCIAYFRQMCVSVCVSVRLNNPGCSSRHRNESQQIPYARALAIRSIFNVCNFANRKSSQSRYGATITWLRGCGSPKSHGQRFMQSVGVFLGILLGVLGSPV